MPGFTVAAIDPKQLDRLRDRFSIAGAKDARCDARVAAAGLGTDPHLFRPVQAGDPAVVELRERSRLADELQQERVRLGNRIRQQLWRHDPQLLELSDDVAAGRVLVLWTMAPIPAKAARLREKTFARLLKHHRIRKVAGSTGPDRRRCEGDVTAVTLVCWTDQHSGRKPLHHGAFGRNRRSPEGIRRRDQGRGGDEEGGRQVRR